MHAFLRVSFVAAMLTASAAPSFADVTLWSNPNNNPFFSYASQQDVNNSANSEALYDNFTLTQAATITSIQWTGTRTNSVPLNGIEFYIYSNSAQNDPGTLLYAAFSPGGNNETFLFPAVSGVNENTYSANTNIDVVTPGQYWLSIVGVVPDGGDLADGFGTYGWAYTFTGDSKGYSDYLGVRTQTNTDFTFTLNGTLDPVVTPPTATTPEPSSLVLMGSGVLSMAGMVRRRLARR